MASLSDGVPHRARIDFGADDKKRDLLREGVRDLLRRYPPKR
jgi:hypothetical protein